MTPSRHMFGVIDPDPHPLVHFLPVLAVEEHEVVVEEELILRLTDVQGMKSGAQLNEAKGVDLRNPFVILSVQ